MTIMCRKGLQPFMCCMKFPTTLPQLISECDKTMSTIVHHSCCLCTLCWCHIFCFPHKTIAVITTAGAAPHRPTKCGRKKNSSSARLPPKAPVKASGERSPRGESPRDGSLHVPPKLYQYTLRLCLCLRYLILFCFWWFGLTTDKTSPSMTQDRGRGKLKI